VGAETVGLVVFVPVPSLGEADLLGGGDTLEVFDYIVVQDIENIGGHGISGIFCEHDLIKTCT